MRKIVGLLAVFVALAVAGPASARANECRHPVHEPHGGPVYPLEIYSEIEANEWYVLTRNAPVGCYYILFEQVKAPVEGERVWHLNYAHENGNGINPDVAPGEVICYQIAQTDDAEMPVGVWRWSNEVCIEGFEGERTGGV